MKTKTLNKKGIIYKATNKINGKSYIGQTINKNFDIYIKRSHKKPSEYSKDINRVFHNAIRKYGWNNFEWEILEKCDSKNELNEMEFHYIKQYNTFFRMNGYNMTFGGEGGGNYTHLFGKENSNWKHGKYSIVKKRCKRCKKEFTSFNIYEYCSTKCFNKDTKTGKNNPMNRPEIKQKHRENIKKALNRPEIKQKQRENTKKALNKPDIKRKFQKLYLVVLPNKKEVIVKGLTNYCKENGLHSGSMFKVCNGSKLSYKNYWCMRIDDFECLYR